MRRAAMMVVLGCTGIAAGQPCAPQWLPPPPGPFLDSRIEGITSWDPDGVGPQPASIVVVGDFQHAGSGTLSFVARLGVGGWEPIGGGTNGTTYAVTSFDSDGSGPGPSELYIGGVFFEAGGGPANEIARWSNGSWLALGSGVAGPSPRVRDFTSAGGELIVGGLFTSAGGLPVDDFARWTGSQWLAFDKYEDLGCGALTVYAGRVVVGSPGPMSVMTWTGTAWLPVGSNHPVDSVDALTVWRGQLIAGGFFDTTTGPGNHIAAFDGNTWNPLGAGIGGTVWALTAWDPDGPGPQEELLVAGGTFGMAGGLPASCIAAWDGNAWSALGAGVNARVNALAVHNNTLLVGGYFHTAGGLASKYFARYGCPGMDCYPDCNGDLALNVNDFVCFQTKFALGDPYSDCDENAVRNVNDYICFQTRFAMGCP